MHTIPSVVPPDLSYRVAYFYAGRSVCVRPQDHYGDYLRGFTSVPGPGAVVVTLGWSITEFEADTVKELVYLMKPMLETKSVKPAPPTHRPLWSIFDANWYMHCHTDLPLQMHAVGLDDPERYYNEYGVKLGHSPNMFFDERWYLGQNPDVAACLGSGEFASGFAHYCYDGYRERSPHWLFSEKLYLRCYVDVSPSSLGRLGLLNGYDHYLTLGDQAFRSGHWFFDAMLYRQNRFDIDTANTLGALTGGDAADGGSFAQFLAGGGAAGSIARVSWYFDPVWYLTAYPSVADEVEAGLWSSALHHFLCNPTPRQYQALEWFSEAYYTATYPDVQLAVEAGHFRNAYEHFIKHGAAELRRPHPAVDLRHYFLSGCVQADLEGGAFGDAFAHWVCRLCSGALGHVVEPIAEGQSKQLFARNAENMLPQFARRVLDFTVTKAGADSGAESCAFKQNEPELSVIVVLHNHFALTMMAMASLRTNFTGRIELILVDSGSYDETRHIERYILGAKVIRFTYNAGFVESCNSALAHVTAPALLYLNNDLLLGMDACQMALARLFSAPSIGGVGAKFIRTNGLLQEAGSIIWRDGTTFGYLRDADPNTPEANFLREVDYCSGAFLMLRTELVRQLGGFDNDYRPAYFEEADLCVRLRKAGWRILYDPAVVVQHVEYGSANITASMRLMARNHKIFTAKHLEYLRHQQPARARNVVHARSPRDNGRVLLPSETRPERDPPLRILFIEDRIPLRNLGSGYVRSNDIIQSMAILGHLVSVFPICKATANPIEIFRDMPETVEVLYERGVEALAGFIKERSGYYDIVWIGRTHNLERLLPILGGCASALPLHGLVLDTEAITAPRVIEQNRALGRPQVASLDAALKSELACAYICQKIIAVNETDAALVRSAGHSNVSVLGHMKELTPTLATWSQRRDLLFLGAIHDRSSPNLDSLEWFISKVLPRLESRLAPEVRFTVAGFVRRGVDLSGLGRSPRVDLIGPVEDLAAIYNRHRVFIAPTRFAGGIPFKVHESAGYGLPVVATDLLCRQLGWRDGVEIMTGGTDDPACFANAILTLYDNPEVWSAQRRSALDNLQQNNSQTQYIEALRDILKMEMHVGAGEISRHEKHSDDRGITLA